MLSLATFCSFSKKKLLSAVLCGFLSLVLVVSLVPSASWAESDSTQSNSETQVASDDAALDVASSTSAKDQVEGEESAPLRDVSTSHASDVSANKNAADENESAEHSSDAQAAPLDSAVRTKDSDAAASSSDKMPLSSADSNASENSEATDSDKTATTSEESYDADEAQKGDRANSFRYTNGELDVQASQGSASRMFSVMAAQGSSRLVDSRGIDVSEHNGDIDWNKAKKSGKVEFAIIRCGYGDDYKNQDDKKWLRNAKECKRLGIPFGVYLYSYAANPKRAASEAKHTLRCLEDAGIKPSDLAYPVYFDMEDRSMGKNKTNLANMAKTFCSAIAKAGYTPGVYANTNWWTNYLTSSVFNNYERWVAQYNRTCTYTGTYRIWQYSSSGSVPGINGRVDMNYDYGPAGTVANLYAVPRKAYPNTLANGEYYLTTSLNGYSVMDIKSGTTANGGNLQLYESNKTKAQRFKITRDAKTGFYTIVNVKSGKALGLKKAKKRYDGNVAQYAKNNNDNAQKWIIQQGNKGSYVIRSAINPDYAIGAVNNKSSNGTNLRLCTYSQTNNAQNFKVSSTAINVKAGANVSQGLYSVASKLDVSKVLDVKSASTSNGAFLQLYDSNETQAQRFRLQKSSKKGFYYLINAKSGKALDVKGGGLVNGAKVQQWTKSNSDNQLWALRKNTDGTYSFQSKTNGLMLDVASAKTANGTVIQTYQSNGTKAQKFVLTNKTNANRTLANGTYSISTASRSDYVLDVAGGSTKNRANVQLYKANRKPRQSYRVTYDTTTGYYTIKNIQSGKLLDAKGNKASNKVNIQQFASNGSLGQKWLIVKNSDGSYTIKSGVNEKYVIDLTSGRVANSSNIQLYESNKSAAQKFKFHSAVFSRTIKNGTYVMRSSLNASYVVGVKGNSTKNKANVQLAKKSSSKAQRFVVRYDSSTGYYTIQNARSGKMLDVSGAKMKSHTNIWQYTNNKSWAQKWIIAKNSDGSYTLKAALDPSFVVTLKGNKASNGRNIELDKLVSSKKGQKFTFGK